MAVDEAIRAKLSGNMNLHYLEIHDESERHIGHAGHDGRGESHFRLLIISDDFEGLGRLDRQRKILDLLEEDLKGRIHALTFTCLSTEEYKKRIN